MQLIPVILSGGIGSRLWPYSRSDFPKPFIELPNNQGTLFKNTISRVLGLPSVEHLIVVSNIKYRHLVTQSENSLNIQDKCLNIWEPEGKNTATAIVLAAINAIKEYGEDCILLVLPADHRIGLVDEFSKAVNSAVQLAKQCKLVTFGIQPTRVETGYGYIEYTGNTVQRFIEKPEYQTAESLIKQGNVAWNSGMFCFTAKTLLAESQKHFPELLKASETLSSIREGNELSFSEQSFAKLPSQSIDYAIMEKSDSLAIIPCDIDWDDIGSWTSYEKLCSNRDEHGNTVQGKVVTVSSDNNLILGGDRLIATVGVANLVIVSTEGATLIANRDAIQDVKKLAERPLVKDNPYAKTQRPWGSYQVIDQGNGYKVKRIEILPGGMLSLQVHQHRDEHWTMVCGEAYVTRDEEIIRVRSNESIFIPKQIKHRLHNRSDQICVLIEVQSGEYLGEDDIIRIEDIYKRS